MATEEEMNEYLGPGNPIGEEIDPREHMEEQEQEQQEEKKQVKVVYIENGGTMSHVGAAVLGGVIAVIGIKVIGGWLTGRTT